MYGLGKDPTLVRGHPAILAIPMHTTSLTMTALDKRESILISLLHGNRKSASQSDREGERETKGGGTNLLKVFTSSIVYSSGRRRKPNI